MMATEASAVVDAKLRLGLKSKEPVALRFRTRGSGSSGRFGETTLTKYGSHKLGRVSSPACGEASRADRQA